MEPDLNMESLDEPGDNFHGTSVSNDDSQQSMTLQNALGPLSDTRPMDSGPKLQTQSLPDHNASVVQLISRPKDSSCSDINIGFTYAPAVKIIPGQFSRRAPSKPGNPISTHGVADDPLLDIGNSSNFNWQTALMGNTIPFPAPQEKALQDDHQPKVVKNISAQVSSASIPREGTSPPMELRPPQQSPNPREQLSSFTTSSVSQHTDNGKTSASRTQGIPHASVETRRTSLPTDVSVSSLHPPRKLPRSSSPHSMVVKGPRRDGGGSSSRLNTPSTQILSPSSSRTCSNIKKKRPTDHMYNHHSSRRHVPHEYNETPSVRGRPPPSPQNQLKQKWRRKVTDSMASFAGSWNQNFAALDEEANEYIRLINSLKSTIEQKQDQLSHYENNNKEKDRAIQRLEEGQVQLLGKLQQTKEELENRSSKLLKIEEKCRTYKEYLNSAVAEQQELYKATKSKCEGAINQMKEEEERRMALQERERVQIEAVREHLKQIVKTTVDEFKRKELESNHTIESLNQKLQERNAEVLREQQKTEVLLQQNENITSVQGTLKSLGAQIQDVVARFDDHSCHQTHCDSPTAEEIQPKLDQIMSHLQSFDEQARQRADLSGELKGLNEKAVASILDKLETIITSQMGTKASLQEFFVGFEENTADCWAALEDREDLIEEFIEQRKDENIKLIRVLRDKINMKERESKEQSDKLSQMEKTVIQHQAVIDDLRQEIAELEREGAGIPTKSDCLDHLHTQHEKLKEEVAAKTAKVSELQKKLEESNSAVSLESEKQKRNAEELRNLIEQQEARAHTAKVQAVEAARCEALAEVNKVRAEIEARLGNVLDERTKLQQELRAARANILAMEMEGSQGIKKIDLLQKDLEKSKADAIRIREDANQKDMAQQAAMQQQLDSIGNLQSRLESCETKFRNLSANVQAYDKAAILMLSGLKQWAHNYTPIRKLASHLEKRQDGGYDGIDPQFKSLIQMNILQKAVMQYCQAQMDATDAHSGVGEGIDRPIVGSTTVKMCFRPGTLSSSHTDKTSKPLPNDLLDQARSVTVQSPVTNASSPRPPSVQTEQERRRTADPPKSIMKPVHFNVSKGIFQPDVDERWAWEGDETQQEVIIGRNSSFNNPSGERQEMVSPKSVKGGALRHVSMLNHGPYNRPVARSNARLNIPAATTSRIPSKRFRTLSEGIEEQIETDLVAVDDKKRKSVIDRDPDTPRKKKSSKRTDGQLTSPIRDSQRAQNTDQHRTVTGVTTKTQCTTKQPSLKPSTNKHVFSQTATGIH